MSKKDNGNRQSGSGWSYSPGIGAILIVRGKSRQYNLSFVAFIRVVVDEEKEKVKSARVFAEEKAERIYSFDINCDPQKVCECVEELIEKSEGSSSHRDTFYFSKKLKNLIQQKSFLYPLAKSLRQNEVQSAREVIRNNFEKKLFPGSEAELEVKICLPRTESYSEQEDSELAEKIKPAIKHCLDISACINPVHGRPLSEISIKKPLLVRVVGDSVKKLNPELVEKNEENRIFSKPIPAALAAIKASPRHGELQYWVRFKEGVYGEGVQAGSARVRVPDSKVETARSEVKNIFYFGLILLSIFVIIMFLLFVGFPDYFFIFLF
jgi:hypothetical protein